VNAPTVPTHCAVAYTAEPWTPQTDTFLGTLSQKKWRMFNILQHGEYPVDWKSKTSPR